MKRLEQITASKRFKAFKFSFSEFYLIQIFEEKKKSLVLAYLKIEIW